MPTLRHGTEDIAQAFARAALLAVALTGGGLLPLATSGPATAEAPRAAAVQQVAPAPGTTMSVAAMSDTAVHLAYTSSQQDVILRNVAAAVPTTVFLGGRLIGGPALAVAPAEVLGPDSALVVFGRGTDNALWWRHQTATGWAPWRSLGGKLTSKPGAAVSMTNEFGALNVFVRGADGYMWYRAWRATGDWGAWRTAIGSSLKRITLLAGTGPGASAGEVAFARTDRHIAVLGRTGTANQFVDFGGLTNADPGATRAPGPSVPVVVAFARGLDNALWYAQSALPLGGAVRWQSLGGQAGVRCHGGNHAQRAGVRVRARWRQPGLDEDGGLAEPRRLDATVTRPR